MLQIGTPFSQAYVEQTLTANPGLARDLANLFDARFDPAHGSSSDGAADRDRGAHRRSAQPSREPRPGPHPPPLSGAASRRPCAPMHGSAIRRRTVSRRTTCPTSSTRSRIPGLPAPRPAFEIFVYAPYVEGVHLRGGKVARGGLRWSDRREDFRTEVLGLMKAQMVKNAVIVPVGAKGGFVLKRPPPASTGAAFMEEGVRCYKVFLRGLLDITDNQGAGGHRPARATWSATTATIPIWSSPPTRGLRPFPTTPTASAASTVSGSTTRSPRAARPATTTRRWASPPKVPGNRSSATSASSASTPRPSRLRSSGVGDMSGDVFGNGMLLSEQIRLVAAFDHRHIFLDPDPDPARSFAERQRLFDLPRSSWDDYDQRPDQRAAAASGRGLAKAIAALTRGRGAVLGDRGRDREPERADERHPQGAGRPVLERWHRHLCQGHERDARPRRRIG